MKRATLKRIACLGASVALASCDGGEAGNASTAGRAATAAQGLYGVDPSTGTFLFIDPATAAATAIGPVGLAVATAGADFACDGTFWALSAVAAATMGLYSVDLGNGAGSLAREFDVAGSSVTSGFEFGLDEATMYWRSGNELRRLDPVAGTTELVGTAGNGGVSLTMPASCDQFLAGDCIAGECELVRLDPGSGALTSVGPTVTPEGVSVEFTSLAAAPDGSLYGHSSGQLFRIDSATGETTLVGNIGSGETSYQPRGMAFGPQGICCRPLDCGAAAPTAGTLWPPNHRMVEVGVAGVVSPGGGPVEVTITGVTQDEPVNATGDGNTEPDAAIAGGTAALRAERSGGGDGRVYHLSFTASSGGQSCAGAVAVCVPHDQGQGASCVDQGPLYDSTVP
jgi:hypothetical protein